jgi:hypothetical protein
VQPATGLCGTARRRAPGARLRRALGRGYHTGGGVGSRRPREGRGATNRMRRHAGVGVQRHRHSWRAVRYRPLRSVSIGPIYRRGGLPCARPRLPRRARGPRPRPARSAGGGCERTGGQSRVWPAANAGAPRGGPDFKGGLGACDILGRRDTSVGTRPKRRGRRGVAWRGVGRPEFVPL